jgi:hypothetical protein
MQIFAIGLAVLGILVALASMYFGWQAVRYADKAVECSRTALRYSREASEWAAVTQKSLRQAVADEECGAYLKMSRGLKLRPNKAWPPEE